MAPSSTPDGDPRGTARAPDLSRAATGRRLLRDKRGVWSALPIEWPRASRADRKAVAAGDLDVEHLPGTAWRILYTIVALVRHPLQSFAHVHEPVSHGVVLGFLAAVRLPFWSALTIEVGVRALLSEGRKPIALLPVHDYLDPRLTEAVELWLLLMVPISLALLYFLLGILSHVALALTGGAPRSIGATMRASGYALTPILLPIALVEVWLWHGPPSFLAFAVIAGILGIAYLFWLGCALAGTHKIPLSRAFLVALVPAGVPIVLLTARALLVLEELPGWEPSSPYFVP